MVHDENKDIFYLYDKMIVDFSSREAGYDMSEYIKMETLEFINEKPDDFKFFDFIETLLIFSKESQRNTLVARLNKVFREENEPFAIHGFMIIETEHSGLRSALPLIKDRHIQKGLREYYRNHGIGDPQYEVLAKISSSVLQRITTSPDSKKDTKDYAEELCDDVASNWTDTDKVEGLKKLLSETILNAKKLSNGVTDIRHSDQNTIPVDNPKIYKLINSKNINLIELIILTLPERFISEQDPGELKTIYNKDYNIDTTASWRIKKRVIEEDINPEDIPF